MHLAIHLLVVVEVDMESLVMVQMEDLEVVEVKELGM